MQKKGFNRLCFFIIMCFSINLLFTGCIGKKSSKEKKADKQIIKVNLGKEPDSLDPALSSNEASKIVIINSFEGLTKLDEKDKPISGVASKWQLSVDKLKYTFTIKENAKWSDGEEVKAEDFEYAWKRALSPKNHSKYVCQMYYLKNGEAYNKGKAKEEDVGVKAIGEKTLEVKLEYPTSYFLSLTALPIYMPVRKDIIEKEGNFWATKAKSYICNGPFKIKTWETKNNITCVKNEEYWNSKSVKLSQIDYKVVVKESKYLASYKSGELDYIAAPPSQELSQLIKEKSAKVYNGYGIYYLNINLSGGMLNNPKAEKALKDVRVRKALSFAINRNELVQSMGKLAKEGANAFIPKGILEDEKKDFNNKDYYNLKGDVTEARRLLKEAGYNSENKFPTLTYLYNTKEENQNIAQIIQEMWKENLEINVELKNEEWSEFEKQKMGKKYMIAKGEESPSYKSPMTFLEMFVSDYYTNESGYSNQKYDKKINEAKKESDNIRKMKLMHEAEDILMDDMPVIPLFFCKNVVCVNSKLKEVHVSPFGYVIFEKAWLEK